MDLWIQIVIGVLALIGIGYMSIGAYYAYRFRRRLTRGPAKVDRLVAFWGVLSAWVAWPYFAGYESGYDAGYDVGHRMGSRRFRR